VTDWAEQLDGLHAGELAATNQIITLVTRYLAHIGAFQLRDSWDDFVQDVLIMLIQKPPRSREAGAIVRHIQTTCRRRNVSFDEVQDPVLADQFWSGRMDIGLRGAIERREARQRTALEAVYFEGFTYEEAAVQLVIPLGTLKGLLREGLSELREKILGEADESSSDSGRSSVSPSGVLARDSTIGDRVEK